jgi:hypothetical protein
MATEKEVRNNLKEHRRPAAVVLLVIAALMLAAPLIIVGFSPGGFSSWVSASVRLTALYAFTFIFMNIVSGALAPYFYAVFNARREYLMHTITGALGFMLALAHGLIVITQRYYRPYNAVWMIGLVTLPLLALTVWVALDRTRLKSVWRFIHQINYAIFVASFIMAVLIGSDFKMTGWTEQLTMVLFSLYMALAAVALALRVRRYQVQAAGRRKSAAARAAAGSGASADGDEPARVEPAGD